MDVEAGRALARERKTISVGEQVGHEPHLRASSSVGPRETNRDHGDAAELPRARATPRSGDRDDRDRKPLTEALPSVRPPGAFDRAVIFLLACVLDAITQTIEWMGFTRLRRLPLSLAVFCTIFFFLGLPRGWVDDPFGGRVLELGHWSAPIAWRAFWVQLTATFALRIVLARPRLQQAGSLLPSQVRGRLIEHADELLASNVLSAEELLYWIEQHDAWLRRALAELTACHSKDVADRLRAVATDKPVQFRHAYNPVHNGWLNLLGRRIDFLRTLSDRDR
jgi:hypothetical protein